MLFRSPRSFRPGFPCLLSRFFVLGFLSISFRPSLIRSHSRSSGAYLLLSLRSFPFRFAFFRPLRFQFLLLSLCFFLSSLFPSPSHSDFLGAPFPLSFLWLSPFFPTWFPVSSLPVLRTRLSVCFLSPFPDSLPQLFLRCLPCAFAFGLFPSALLSFVRFASGSGYSASVSSFPLSSRLRLTVAFPVPASALASSVSPFSPT